VTSRHILVTGGAGFVGSHLVDRLVADGNRVTVLDNLSSGCRKNLHHDAVFCEGDVRDGDLLGRLINEADSCFHLAAIASVPQCNTSWIESHDVNMRAFLVLLEKTAKRKNGAIPVVYASSAAVYGNSGAFPTHEDLPLRPLSVYGADKAGCEMHAIAAGRNANVPTFGLRPFNIYGTRQNPSSPYSGVISIFADRLWRGEEITIYGDGKQTRDFVHIDDAVTFFIAALGKASPDAPVCNVATGKETSVLSAAHQIAEILKRKAKVSFAPARMGDIYRSVADIGRAELLLGYKAKIKFEDGLSFVREAGQ